MSTRQQDIKKTEEFSLVFFLYKCARAYIIVAIALGTAAASFWSAAEKDIAEGPTRSGTPK